MNYRALFAGILCLFMSAVYADEYITFPPDKENVNEKVPVISAMVSGNDEVWAGTASGTLYRIFQEKNKWNAVKFLSINNERITHLFIKDSLLLIGTEKALYSSSVKNAQSIDKIIETGSACLTTFHYKNDFWTVTKKNVMKVYPGTKNSPRELQLFKSKQTAIHTAFYGFDKLYIESDEGFLEINCDTDHSRPVIKSSALNGVMLINGAFRDGEMWFGTSSGLFTFKSQDSLWNKLAFDNELPDIVLLSSLWYGQYLWLGTMRGVICLDANANQVIPVAMADSLKNIPVHSIVACQNSVFMGFATNGLLVKEVNDIPYVSLSDAQMRNDSVVVTATVYGNTAREPFFSYSPNISPLVSITDGLKVQKTADKNIVKCVWNVNKVPDGEYIICAMVEDQKKRANVTELPVTISKQKSELILDPIAEYCNTQIVTISGICVSAFKPQIKILPESFDLQFQNEKMRFSGKVRLNEGNNPVVVGMYDPSSGRKISEAVRNVVFDNTAPGIAIDTVFTAHDTQSILSGTYIDQNPDRIELYDRSDTLKAYPDRGAFIMKVKSPYGKTSYTMAAIDKAGNKTNFKTSVLFDTLPPAFALIECPAYTNKDSVTIRGFFNEANIESIKIMPYEKNAFIDLTSAKFTCSIPLHDGLNVVECVLRDLAGMQRTEKLWITLDKAPPQIVFDSFPLATSRSPLALSGYVKDLYSSSVKLSTESIPVKYNQADNHFDFSWPLQFGMNTLDISATDLAGNTVARTVKVEYTGQQGKGDAEKTYKELQEAVTSLVNENATLRQQIENGVQVQQPAGAQVAAPAKNRYIIYTVKKDETLYYLSQKFYGKIDYYQQIADFNKLDVNEILVAGREIKIPILDEGVTGVQIKELNRESAARVKVPLGYIRQAPVNTATVAGVLVKNDLVEIRETKGEWYRIQTAQGTAGWVHRSLLDK